MKTHTPTPELLRAQDDAVSTVAVDPPSPFTGAGAG
jgi:hypothetical protein